MISRLRSNSNIFELPKSPAKIRQGRPAKYGKKSGSAKTLAAEFKDLAIGCEVNLYGRIRTVVACERLVMLKTIKRAVKVVWIYRQSQWVALFSTDTTLVLIELERRRAQVSYIRTVQGFEVDFPARYPSGKMELLHVCADAAAAGVTARELRALVTAGSQFPGAGKRLLTLTTEGLPRDVPDDVLA